MWRSVFPCNRPGDKFKDVFRHPLDRTPEHGSRRPPAANLSWSRLAPSEVLRTGVLTVLAVLGLLAMILAAAGSFAFGLGPSLGMAWLRRLVRARFPQAPQWTAEDAETRLRQAIASPILVVDLRPAPEFDVSHLPGARNIASGRLLEELRCFGNQESAVLVYCAVGYRASACVTQLRASGFQNCYNLDGGIFEWANAGRPMVGLGGPTAVVYSPYGLFRGLIRPASRAAARRVTSA